MTQVIQFTDRGIYIPAAGAFVDPWKPVDRAVITHAHADHARAGHGAYLATPDTGVMLRHRLGDVAVETLPYGHPRQIGDARLSFHPAGHLPGSAQVRVEVGGEVWVISGDYKVEDDGLSTPFEPVPCHSFVTECTFGLPVFKWAPQARIADQVNDWWDATSAAGQTSILAAYSLGKAQRLIHLLNPDIGPILTHPAVEGTNRVLRDAGLSLPQTQALTDEMSAKTHPGALIVAPPGAIDGAWRRRFGAASTAMASGWMQLRGVRRRRALDRGFVISDHADWPGLMQAIKATGAENIYVTHGYTDNFQRYLSEQGWNAQIVPTEFGEGEDGA